MSAVEQPTAPEEAIEAATDAVASRFTVLNADRRSVARIALAAAVPVIEKQHEKQLRARLADEIEAFGAMQQELAADGILQAAATIAQVWLAAARIVRGEQP